MALLLESTLLELIAAVALLCFWFYKSYTKDYDYWEKKGVPHKKPTFPFGSMKMNVTGKEPWCLAYDNVYKEFEGERYCGVYELYRPVLVIRDPELVKHIMITDFNHFMDRAAFDVGQHETIHQHLFSVGGDKWRKMRQTFSPAFSSGKMKNMFHLMLKCSEQIEPFLGELTESNSVVNVKDLLSRFTMDVISSCAFGAEIYSLKDKESEFFKIGRSIFQLNKLSLLRHLLVTVFPKISQLLNINRTTKIVRDTFTGMIRDTVEYREKNSISRQDFLDILIKIRQNKSILDGTEEEEYQLKDGNKNEGLSIDEMTAQSFIFFIAGFETSSSTMTFGMYELAQNEEVQERLYEEVQQVLKQHGGELTYQALQDMKYLDQVVNETLRMYASLGVLHRRCTERYKIPGSDLILEKGQKVFIPAYSIHHDPKYYPEPFKFNPDRFSAENLKHRPSYLHMPFGAGPRHCIGLRFGMMQSKIGIATIISKFKIQVAPTTHIPINYLPVGIVTQPDRPVLLKFSKRA